MAESSAATLGQLQGGTSTGLSLTTTATFAALPKNAKHLFMAPHTFASSAVVARIAINPYLVILKTTNALASAPTEYSEAAQDGSTSTDVVLSSLGTAAQLDFLYVGAVRPFGGVYCDVDAPNGTASVITVKYWDGDSWADISATDGTASGGASMAQDGSVTWTVPSDWAPTTLLAAGDTDQAHRWCNQSFYWTRWEFSGGLDSSTTLNAMLAAAPDTAFFELISGKAFEQGLDRQHHASIQALTDTGTAKLVVGFAAGVGGRY